MPRTTLATPTRSIEGIGLNTGRRTRLTLRPAPPGTGLRFHWSGQRVTASIKAARVPPFCSALALPDGTLLRTPEHLLAALIAYGVDDAEAHIEGAAEIPILDGSALPWCELLHETGLRAVEAPRPTLRLTRSVEITRDYRTIRAEPARTLTFDVSLDLAAWGEIRWTGDPLGDSFLRELAPARSFGRLRWALPAALLSLITTRPVLRGARFSNTAPLIGAGILGGARLPDEPVRHRALDLLGDLALLGAPLAARITASRPAHAINQTFVRALLDSGALIES